MNYQPESYASFFYKEHGPSACAMGFRTRDAAKAFKKAIELGAEPMYSQAGPMELNIPAIKGIGGMSIFLVDRDIYENDFVFFDDVEKNPKGAGLNEIDHLTHNVYKGRMEYWANFYEKIFNFQEIRYFDIKGEYTGLTSKALTAPDGMIRIPLNEDSDKGNGQIAEFLADFNGEGIQHIAFITDDLLSTWDKLKGLGLEFMTPPPETYYEMLKERLPEHGEPTEELKSVVFCSMAIPKTVRRNYFFRFSRKICLGQYSLNLFNVKMMMALVRVTSRLYLNRLNVIKFAVVY